MVGPAVASLEAQTYAGRLHIIVVDDNSDDGTAEEVRSASARAQVIPGEPLPPGWSGKLWAVAQGVEVASESAPDYLLLTDADIVHDPRNVESLVARAERHSYDLVSLMVRLRCASIAEKATIPAFVFFFFQLYPPDWIAQDDSRIAGAAGGCMLVKRTTLEYAGGIAGIRGELIDDCALARRLKDNNARIWLGLAAETRSIRPYETPAPIWNMVARTAFTQLQHSWWLLAGTVVGMVVVYIVPVALTIATAGITRALAALAWMLMTLLYLPAIRYYRLSALWSLVLPLTALFYLAATVESALRTLRGQGGAWKGRYQDLRT